MEDKLMTSRSKLQVSLKEVYCACPIIAENSFQRKQLSNTKVFPRQHRGLILGLVLSQIFFITYQDEEEINREELPETLPILSLRNTVLFPGVVIPITAGRDKSIKLINDANKSGKIILNDSSFEYEIGNHCGRNIGRNQFYHFLS